MVKLVSYYCCCSFEFINFLFLLCHFVVVVVTKLRSNCFNSIFFVFAKAVVIKNLLLLVYSVLLLY